MCGIVGYIGKNNTASDFVLSGLQALEYRGYDSAGITLFNKDKPFTVKQVGRVEGLKEALAEELEAATVSALSSVSGQDRSTQRAVLEYGEASTGSHNRKMDKKPAESGATPQSRPADEGSVAIGHTRWATHGAPTIQNAHPHFNHDETIFVVHNGIIENHQEIRERLKNAGYKFVSETDTEVIPNLIDFYLRQGLQMPAAQGAAEERKGGVPKSTVTAHQKAQQSDAGISTGGVMSSAHKQAGAVQFLKAFKLAIKDLHGAYAIAALHADDPGSLYVARLSSPLVIGVGEGEHFLASDATALLHKTKKVIYLEDYETAKITKDKVTIHNIRKEVEVQREHEELDYDAEKFSLGDYPHYMLKEIYEAPQTIQSASRGRVKFFGQPGGASRLEEETDLSLSSGVSRTDGTTHEQRKGKSAYSLEATGSVAGSADLGGPHQEEIFDGVRQQASAARGSYTVKLGGLESVDEQLRFIDRIVIVACGTSYYAGLVGEYLIEELAGIPVEVQLASEFKYRKEPFSRSTALLAISQSGETADTIAAIKKVENYGVLKLGVVNAVGSTIARITDAGVYCHAGHEQSVASTKAFIAQVTVLTEIALHLSRGRTPLYKPLLEELTLLPEKAKQTLKNTKTIEGLAKKYAGYRDFLFIGRNYLYPCALEGALKLKEISYIHAEGYAAGEMKHGPLAMIDKNFPTFALATDSPLLEKTLSSIEEIRARKGPVLAIATEGNKEVTKLADDVIYIPKTAEQLQPLLIAIVLQLFSYYVAVEKDLNVDRPRNLAKSVTVE